MYVRALPSSILKRPVLVITAEVPLVFPKVMSEAFTVPFITVEEPAAV